MKIRCSPYNPLLFLVAWGILVFCNGFAAAQCRGDITFQSYPSQNGPSSGKIELFLKEPQTGSYTFKVYEMTGRITLIQTKQAVAPQKVTFENLKPARYFVKVEWGESCYRTLGGLEGISITEKDQGR